MHMNILKILEKGKTTSNRLVCASALKRLGLHSPRSAAPPTAHSGTFQPAANLAVCLLGGLERRIQPERYMTLGLKYFEYIDIN